MSTLDRVRSRALALRGQAPARKGWSEPPLWSADRLSQQVWWGGSAPDRERIDHNYNAYVELAGKGNGVVASCCYARLRVFADAQFLWRDRVDGQLGPLYDSEDLALLRRPWEGSALNSMLAWMEVDATYAGNSYWTIVDDEGRYGRAAARSPSRRLARMRPDWVTLLIGSHSGDPNAIDARVIAILYEPPSSGIASSERQDKVLLLPSEVCHYAPLPDPKMRHRGMSWLTPVLREIEADAAATEHKLKRFQNGAQLQTMVSLDKEVSPEAFSEFVKRFTAAHEGPANAYKTVFVGGGADIRVIGADLKALDFKGVQGGGETRIAAMAGVHPVVVGLSEGLSGSSLNAGNYSAARRNVSDGTLQQLWREASTSLETLFRRPNARAELHVDRRDIAFLREDAKDIAEIQQKRAQALRTLTDAGWKPDAAIAYLQTDDITRLAGEHSGLFSVQLQPPGSRTGTTEGGA